MRGGKLLRPHHHRCTTGHGRTDHRPKTDCRGCHHIQADSFPAARATAMSFIAATTASSAVAPMCQRATCATTLSTVDTAAELGTAPSMPSVLLPQATHERHLRGERRAADSKEAPPGTRPSQRVILPRTVSAIPRAAQGQAALEPHGVAPRHRTHARPRARCARRGVA